MNNKCPNCKNKMVYREPEQSGDKIGCVHCGMSAIAQWDNENNKNVWKWIPPQSRWGDVRLETK